LLLFEATLRFLSLHLRAALAFDAREFQFRVLRFATLLLQLIAQARHLGSQFAHLLVGG
jgi:hypothetical protein